MSHTEAQVETHAKETEKKEHVAPAPEPKAESPFKHDTKVDDLSSGVEHLKVTETQHLKITDEQIKELEAEFKKSDLNKDGKLSKKEYYTMLRIDGHTLKEKHLKSFFFAIEPDTNGAVSFDELIALMNDVKNGHDEKLKHSLVENLFKHYDKNHDGTISFKEFKRIVHDFDVAYGEKVRDLYDQIDVDHDHKITKEELEKHLGPLMGL